MKTLFHLFLNLQQGIIFYNRPTVVNTIVAIYSIHKGVIVIRPEYRREHFKIVDLVKESTKGEDVADWHVMYGDSFHVDTWDEKIENFGK